MTVTVLRPEPALPEPLAELARARAAIVAAASRPVAELSDAELEAAIAGGAALQSQTDAWLLGLAAEADRRRLADRHADTGTDAWLSRLTGDPRELKRGGLLLADRLERTYTATLQALAAGEVRLEQARVIVEALDISVDDATAEQLAQAEEWMIAKATGAGSRSGVPMTSRALRRAGRRAFALIDAELSARHLERSIQRAERRGRSETWFTIHDRGDGVYTGRFSLPEFHGELLTGYLEHLSAPRVFTRDRSGAEIMDESAGSAGSGLGWADKLGLAFCELIEHLPADRLPRSALTLMVTTTLDALRTGLGLATTTTGTDISAAEARRLACDAGIVPAVLGGQSQPLDLGRTRRLFTDKQRQAGALRYHSCAIAGCDRPVAWSEWHHLQPWSQGGRTDLDQAIPACGFHHRKIHDPDYELHRHDDLEWSLKCRQRPYRRRDQRP